ncbi:hypothetical protein DERP_011735 [Dermatophagoides pteronyssinus]|uniref:Uncharacterized protein n=1 Tax=Dermatophagoides pteronyssinus TaxID=6956 RepID=A0ABQ8J350_DERPT|nr:hypothetical protein DERP_011735 [Dermatophagoides pteronyssinus]
MQKRKNCEFSTTMLSGLLFCFMDLIIIMAIPGGGIQTFENRPTKLNELPPLCLAIVSSL